MKKLKTILLSSIFMSKTSLFAAGDDVLGDLGRGFDLRAHVVHMPPPDFRGINLWDVGANLRALRDVRGIGAPPPNLAYIANVGRGAAIAEPLDFAIGNRNFGQMAAVRRIMDAAPAQVNLDLGAIRFDIGPIVAVRPMILVPDIRLNIGQLNLMDVNAPIFIGGDGNIALIGVRVQESDVADIAGLDYAQDIAEGAPLDPIPDSINDIKELLISAPHRITPAMLEKFKVMVLQKMIDESQPSRFDVLKELLMNPVSYNMAKGLLQKFLTWKNISLWQQNKLSMQIGALMGEIGDEEFKTEIRAQIKDRLRLETLSWGDKKHYIYQIGVLEGQDQLDMISYILDSCRQGGLLDLDLCAMMNTLLGVESAKEMIFSFIKERVLLENFEFERTQHYLKIISSFPAPLQNEVIEYTTKSAREGAMTHDQLVQVVDSFIFLPSSSQKTQFIGLLWDFVRQDRIKKSNKIAFLRVLCQTGELEEKQIAHAMLKDVLFDEEFAKKPVLDRISEVEKFKGTGGATWYNEFLTILDMNLIFEQFNIMLDTNIDHGNVHATNKIAIEAQILHTLLDEEQGLSGQDLIDAIKGYLSNVQSASASSSENPFDEIASRLPPDVISLAMDHLGMIEHGFKNPASSSGEWGNLWSKKAFGHEIRVKDKDGSDLILGRVIDLIFNKISRSAGHAEYTTSAAAFINALGSKDAILKCGTGAVGGVTDSVYALLFSPTDIHPFDENAKNLIDAQLPQVKYFMLKTFDFSEIEEGEIDSDLHAKLVNSSVIQEFITHVRAQNWDGFLQEGSLWDIYKKDEQEGVIRHMNLLLLDPMIRTYFSHFQQDYIRSASLKISLINEYLESIGDIPTR